MTAVNHVSSSGSLATGNGHKSTNNGGIRIAIESSSGPSEENLTKNAEDAEKTEAGKKAQEGTTDATTVAPESAGQQAIVAATKKGISIGDVISKTENTQQVWEDIGAQVQPRTSNLLTTIGNNPEVPGSNRTQILGDFSQLQERLSTNDKLIGGFEPPDASLTQQSQAPASSYSPFGQGGGGQQGNGGSPVAIAQSFSSSSSNSGPVVVGGDNVQVIGPPPVEISQEDPSDRASGNDRK